MFYLIILYYKICPLKWTYWKEGTENEMSQVWKRKCHGSGGHRNQLEDQTSWYFLVVVYRLVVVAHQMAHLHYPCADCQNFCTQEIQNKDQTPLHVCLPELRLPLESINIIRPAPSATEGPGCHRINFRPLPVSTFMVLSHCVSVKVQFSNISTMRVISCFVSET